jgi:hypothetical protein
MYIVKRGSLNVVSDDGKVVFVTLNEVCFVCFALNYNDLWDALQIFPDAKKMLLSRGWTRENSQILIIVLFLGRELLRKDGLLLETVPEDEDSGPTRTVEEHLRHIQRNAHKLEREIDILYKQFQVGDILEIGVNNKLLGVIG